MSLAILSQVEKTESLTYAILPVTLSLVIGTLVSTDIAVWLSSLAIIAPILTILLYELTPEENRIKAVFERYLNKNLEANRPDFFTCNLFIRSWESTLRPYDGVHDTIEEDLTDFVRSALASSVAKQHFLRFRTTWYLRFSVPLMILTGFRFLYLYIESVGAPVVASFFGFAMASVLLLLAVILLICAPVIIWLFDRMIVQAKAVRTQETNGFLNAYFTYLYWSTMVNSDTARTPSEYQPSSIKGIVKNELDALDRHLMRNDWDVFIQRWSRLSRNVNDLAKDEFCRSFLNRIYALWGQFIFQRRSRKDTKRITAQLEWLMYYAAGVELPDTERLLLMLLQSRRKSEGGIDALYDPVLMFELLKQPFLTEDGSEARVAGAVAGGINTIFNNSVGDISQAARKVIAELHVPSIDISNRLPMALFVMNYITERIQLEMEPFLKGYDAEVLQSLFSYVQGEDNRVWLLVDWFKEAAPREVTKAIDVNIWKGILVDEPVKSSVVERMRKYDGSFSEEIDALMNFRERLSSPQDNSAIDELNATLARIRNRRAPRG